MQHWAEMGSGASLSEFQYQFQIIQADMLWLAKFGGMGNISQATSKLANGMNTEIKMP